MLYCMVCYVERIDVHTALFRWRVVVQPRTLASDCIDISTLKASVSALKTFTQIAAGSVVLRDLPPHSTAAGVPAKIVGVATETRPSEVVDQNLRHVRFLKDGNGRSSYSGKTDDHARGSEGASSSMASRRRDRKPLKVRCKL